MNQHTVLFFGPLREQYEAVQVEVEMPKHCTVLELCEQLKIDPAIIKVAVDGEIVPISAILSKDSEIALLPPVSGG
jgi:molybdopterin converting factor small subunit